MEKDNKILLGAVLILLVAMLSFNFNSLTGEATKNVVTISANPSNLYFSETDLIQQPSKPLIVTLRVQSGSVENKIYLYRDDGQRIKSFVVPECQSNCKKGTYTFEYLFTTDLPEGDYYLAVNDRETSVGNGFNRNVFKSNTISLTKFTSSTQY